MTNTMGQDKTASASLGNVDLDWAPEPLWVNWPRGRDSSFILVRMEDAFERMGPLSSRIAGHEITRRARTLRTRLLRV